MWRLFGITSLMSSGALANPTFDGKLRNSTDGSVEAYLKPPYKSNHASTLEVLPDGTLALAWFSGEKEEAPGCAIVVSTLPPGHDTWTDAITVSKQSQYSNQNPVLFYNDHDKLLHLFHSHAPAMSGESKSSIMHLTSKDEGVTWTDPQEWLTLPGAFPRNRIVPAPNGGVIFPFYNASSSPEFKHENYAIAGISPSDRDWNVSKWELIAIPGSADLVQPSAVQSKNGTIITFFRDRRAEHIYRAEADPTGHKWSHPDTSAHLPNNNAGIEANIIKTKDRIVLAYNPQTAGRDPLSVAFSDDYGITWPYKRFLQHGNSFLEEDSMRKGNEFSYPSTLVTYDSNGEATLHVTYTYNRDTIKYKRFNEQWVINGSGPSPTPSPSPPPGKWICFRDMDATGKTKGNFTMVGITKEIEDCQKKCDEAGENVCGVFDWNKSSGHCYLRYDAIWKPVENPRVTSCCLRGVVDECHQDYQVVLE